MTDRDLNRMDPIVPESDERIGRGKPSGGPSSSGRKKAPAEGYTPAKASGGFFWKLLTLILLLGLAALGYLLLQETERRSLLESRFNDLEAKIVSTDESLNQSGAALAVKLKGHDEVLDKHWSEIKKLWGIAYDRNRKNIEAQAKTIDAQVKTIKGLQASSAARKKEVAALTEKLVKASKSVDAMSSTSLAMKLEVNDALERSQLLVDQLNSLEQQLKASQQDFKIRISSNEEAINAIDAYRLQVNRDIQQIKQQLGGSSSAQ